MSEENNISQPILLSQAKKNRRENDSNGKIELSETPLREIISECTEKSEKCQRKMMTEVVNEEVSSKITRLEN